MVHRLRLQAWRASPKDLGELFAPIIAKGEVCPPTENHGSVLKKLALRIYFVRERQEKSRLRKQTAFFSEIRLRRVKYGFAM